MNGNKNECKNEMKRVQEGDKNALYYRMKMSKDEVNGRLRWNELRKCMSENGKKGMKRNI